VFATVADFSVAYGICKAQCTLMKVFLIIFNARVTLS